MHAIFHNLENWTSKYQCNAGMFDYLVNIWARKMFHPSNTLLSWWSHAMQTLSYHQKLQSRTRINLFGILSNKTKSIRKVQVQSKSSSIEQVSEWIPLCKWPTHGDCRLTRTIVSVVDCWLYCRYNCWLYLRSRPGR